ncbi:hypothetical protein [Streptomyces sp. NPDC090080]|uniref:SLAC1 family transporter n=1 Tax=Streptomyces sp. NPDC090080 TaxID=3365939 RepID=UPI00382F79A9
MQRRATASTSPLGSTGKAHRMIAAEMDPPEIRVAAVETCPRPPHSPDRGSSQPTPPPARGTSISLLSMSLGTAGVAGAWDSAVALVGAPVRVSDALFALSGLMWTVLFGMYLVRGGYRWRHFLHDLHHPQFGYAFAYVPIIGMLSAGHFSRYGLLPARLAYVLFCAVALTVSARLLAHWFTGGLSSVTLHPGYMLPLTSSPFIASSVASVVRWHHLALALFAVGIMYWLTFGTVILGSLVSNGNRLPTAARPTLAVLMIPPATGGIAWMASRHGQIDGVAYGLAGILAFTALMTVMMLPAMRQTAFHLGFWVFLFPIAASSNFTIRLINGSGLSAARPLTWTLLGLVSGGLGVLYTATVVHGMRGRRCQIRARRHRRVG